MKYCCDKCKKILSDNWEERFIAEDGRYLCDKCSVNVIPVSEELRNKLRKYEIMK